MKICFFGNYDPDYSRNKILMKGLIKNGESIIPCNYYAPRLNWDIKSMYYNFKSQIKILSKLLKITHIDYYVIAYPLIKSIFLTKLIKRKKVVLDPFISNYNSIINDLKLFSNNSLKAKLIKIFDNFIFSTGKIILADTYAHAKYYSKEFNISLDSFKVIYVGADNELYFPRKKLSNKEFIVGFYGSYLPLQGTDIIIKAANLLKKDYPKIRFELIGGDYKNNLFKKILKMVKLLNLKNVKLIKKIPENKLPFYIQRSDVQLGIFGDTLKAKLVIPNKAFTAIAMKKPLITANTPAIKEIFKNNHTCLLCKIANPEDLSNKIIKLYNNKDLCKSISENAFKMYIENYTPEILGKKLKEILSRSR
ncbi:MAG: glycosyltransferase family 4 protein [Promethearchaeota archaeon]